MTIIEEISSLIYLIVSALLTGYFTIIEEIPTLIYLIVGALLYGYFTQTRLVELYEDRILAGFNWIFDDSE